MPSIKKEPLFTRNYIAACTANFLYFFGFYSLLPILALYLIENFSTDKIITGAIIASYTLAALLFRPFGGFLVDTLNRKKLYAMALLLFILCFAGYPIAGSISLFVFFRILHGLSFGVLTVTANTLVIDISPASRRGEALGTYGIANTTAMVFGPMTAVYIHQFWGYNAVFYTALILGMVAFIIGAGFIHPPAREAVERTPISWDRFILFKGLPAGSVLLMLGIPYGMITSYISLFSKEIGLGTDTGWFYSFMAIGTILSRLYSGKRSDRGKLSQVIILGTILTSIALLIIYGAHFLSNSSQKATMLLFNSAAFLVGFGYGSVFPAMNTLFINLATHNKRGTANSTYMTTWEIGIGIGLLITPQIGDSGKYANAFLLGAIAAIISICIFVFYVQKHYEKNRLS